jgi:hypothetical protein
MQTTSANLQRLTQISVGTTSVDGEAKNFSFQGPSLQSHVHVIGASRYGKSKLIEHIFRQKMKFRNSGFILIDPHGTLYHDLCVYIARAGLMQTDRIVLFNPAGNDRQKLGFNPIPPYANDPEYMAVEAENLTNTCLRAWGQDASTETPRIRRWLQNIFKTIIACDLTFVEAMALIQTKNIGLRQRMVQHAPRAIREDWEVFDALKPIHRQLEYMEGAGNRLRSFLLNPHLRRILGSKQNTLNIPAIMDEGKILLVNLHGGNKLDRDNMRLLGSLLVSEIFRASLARNPNDKRLRPCDVVIDEFPEYVNRDVARMLDQSGKFQTWLWLIHQHMAQLETSESEASRQIANSVKSNCSTKIAFGGLSYEDAKSVSLELFTGYMGVEQKRIKDEVYQQKEKRILTNIPVFSETESETETHGSSTSNADTYTETIGKASSGNSSWGSSSSGGHSQSGNRSRSSGYSKSSSSGYRFGDSGSGSDQYSLNHGTSHSSGSIRSDAWSNHSSWSNDSGGSSAYSRSRVYSESETTTHTNSHSVSHGKSRTRTDSPMLLPEYFQELSNRTYWSLPENQEIALAKLKNLKKQFAYIKQHNLEPILVKVDYVQSLPPSRLNSTSLQQLLDRVFDHDLTLYKSEKEMDGEIESRQLQFFGETLFESSTIWNVFSAQEKMQEEQEASKKESDNQTEEPKESRDTEPPKHEVMGSEDQIKKHQIQEQQSHQATESTKKHASKNEPFDQTLINPFDT